MTIFTDLYAKIRENQELKLHLHREEVRLLRQHSKAPDIVSALDLARKALHQTVLDDIRLKEQLRNLITSETGLTHEIIRYLFP